MFNFDHQIYLYIYISLPTAELQRLNRAEDSVWACQGPWLQSMAMMIKDEVAPSLHYLRFIT